MLPCLLWITLVNTCFGRSAYPCARNNPRPRSRSLELFRQLTLIELHLFQAIRPLDLIHKSKGRLSKAPHLASIIQRFNHVSYWVATEVVMNYDLKQRAEVLKRFIQIAQMCFEHRNFNTWYVLALAEFHRACELMIFSIERESA
jgi:hypothetical protein